MNPLRLAGILGVLAAVVLAVGAALALGGDDLLVLPVLGYAAAVLALAALGHTLVARAPGWLKAVVTVAVPVLAAMVWVLVVLAVSRGTSLALAAVAMLAIGVPVLVAGRRSGSAEVPEPTGVHRR